MAMITKDTYIVVLGCFDTKGEDFTYLIDCLKSRGQQVIAMDTGVMESSVDFPVDYTNEQVAANASTSLESLRKSGDRGKAVELMGRGASIIIAELVKENKVKGVIGMGGGGGTYYSIGSNAIRSFRNSKILFIYTCSKRPFKTGRCKRYYIDGFLR